MNKILIILAAVALTACSKSQEQSAEPHTVYTTHPTSDASAGKLTFAGVAEEGDNISLGFKTAGQLKRIFVKEGDHVRSGQLLAELDADDYRLGVEALQIQYDQLKEEVERARRLFAKKSMSANDYEKAEAGLRQLGVQLQVNKNKLAYTRLYAPTAGIIEAVNFSPAEMVDAGTAVFSMLDTGGLEVVCDIPAKVYRERESFTDFSCRSSLDGAEVPLRLLSIVPKADGNQLYRMHLAVENPALLTAGMNVEVSIATDSGEGGAASLSIPSSAIFRHDGKTCVWLLQPDSTVVLREVSTEGGLDGSSVAVSSGLSPADEVVRAGVSALHEGEKVRVVEQPSATNVGGLL